MGSRTKQILSNESAAGNDRLRCGKIACNSTFRRRNICKPIFLCEIKFKTRYINRRIDVILCLLTVIFRLTLKNEKLLKNYLQLMIHWLQIIEAEIN